MKDVNSHINAGYYHYNESHTALEDKKWSPNRLHVPLWPPPRAASGVCLKLQQAPAFQIHSLMLCCSIEHFFSSCQLFFYSQYKLEQQSQVNICSGPAWISTCFYVVYIECIRIIRRTRWHSQLFWWPPGTSPLTPGFEFQLETTQIIVKVCSLSSWNSDSPFKCLL